ncbi:hypothetical protein PBY51_018961 [Eleginops maclovinus]|uniref:Uncharacterized protein n=1 Tax=Eleginops maclovinus TaxID=56733 RepID=A0AAN7YBE8_ELEMC|nr:hypothetical protein PBY51_018961 [Eleginops maclovinus]
MIRIIRISSLCLRSLHQLHAPELGLCQSGFPCSARLVLSVCLHTEESCVSGKVGVMNGEEGWETDPVSADIPTGSPHRGHCATDATTATLCHNRKQKD